MDTAENCFSICIICGKQVPQQFWVCGKCLVHKDNEPGQSWDLSVPFSSWPKWAKYLKQQEQNRRRLLARRTIEYSLDELLLWAM
jgi:hypothetical protein